MAKEQIIKSGQITLPRLLFLAVVGALVVASVAGGKIWLTIGYWGLTIAISTILFFVAVDYGIQMEKVDTESPSSEPSSAVEPETLQQADATASRPKRRTSRPKRRR